MKQLTLSERAVAACLLVSALAAGGCVKDTVDLCEDDPTRDGCDGAGDRDAGGDAGPCGECTAALPFCDEEAGRCVGCLGEMGCGAGAPFCVDGSCVACRDGDDCMDAAAPFCVEGGCAACRDDDDCDDPALARCDTAGRTCAPCTASAQCPDDLECVTDAADARAGTCVACIPGDPADEAAACSGGSCDPATYTCTGTPIRSVRRCAPCVTDTECRETDDRCVPMNFQGAPIGAFCLKRFATGCVEPFTVPTDERASLSGAEAEAFCGVNETATTCTAVLDLIDNATCSTAGECGRDDTADGRCETVNGLADRCTYSCGLTSQCPSGVICGSGYCGGQL